MRAGRPGGSALQLRIAVLLTLVSTWAYAQEAQQPSLHYPARYMGGPANLANAPNGALIYDRVLKVGPEVFYLEQTVKEVTDGVWVIGGVALVNCIVVEAPEGLIVYDIGDNAETGKRFRELSCASSGKLLRYAF